MFWLLGACLRCADDGPNYVCICNGGGCQENCKIEGDTQIIPSTILDFTSDTFHTDLAAISNESAIYLVDTTETNCPIFFASDFKSNGFFGNPNKNTDEYAKIDLSSSNGQSIIVNMIKTTIINAGETVTLGQLSIDDESKITFPSQKFNLILNGQEATSLSYDFVKNFNSLKAVNLKLVGNIDEYAGYTVEVSSILELSTTFNCDFDYQKENTLIISTDLQKETIFKLSHDASVVFSTSGTPCSALFSYNAGSVTALTQVSIQGKTFSSIELSTGWPKNCQIGTITQSSVDVDIIAKENAIPFEIISKTLTITLHKNDTRIVAMPTGNPVTIQAEASLVDSLGPREKIYLSCGPRSSRVSTRIVPSAGYFDVHLDKLEFIEQTSALPFAFVFDTYDTSTLIVSEVVGLNYLPTSFPIEIEPNFPANSVTTLDGKLSSLYILIKNVSAFQGITFSHSLPSTIGVHGLWKKTDILVDEINTNFGVRVSKLASSIPFNVCIAKSEFDTDCGNEPIATESTFPSFMALYPATLRTFNLIVQTSTENPLVLDISSATNADIKLSLYSKNSQNNHIKLTFPTGNQFSTVDCDGLQFTAGDIYASKYIFKDTTIHSIGNIPETSTVTTDSSSVDSFIDKKLNSLIYQPSYLTEIRFKSTGWTVYNKNFDHTLIGSFTIDTPLMTESLVLAPDSSSTEEYHSLTINALMKSNTNITALSPNWNSKTVDSPIVVKSENTYLNIILGISGLFTSNVDVCEIENPNICIGTCDGLSASIDVSTLETLYCESSLHVYFNKYASISALPSNCDISLFGYNDRKDIMIVNSAGIVGIHNLEIVSESTDTYGKVTLTNSSIKKASTFSELTVDHLSISQSVSLTADVLNFNYGSVTSSKTITANNALTVNDMIGNPSIYGGYLSFTNLIINFGSSISSVTLNVPDETSLDIVSSGSPPEAIMNLGTNSIISLSKSTHKITFLGGDFTLNNADSTITGIESTGILKLGGKTLKATSVKFDKIVFTSENTKLSADTIDITSVTFPVTYCLSASSISTISANTVSHIGSFAGMKIPIVYSFTSIADGDYEALFKNPPTIFGGIKNVASSFGPEFSGDVDGFSNTNSIINFVLESDGIKMNFLKSISSIPVALSNGDVDNYEKKTNEEIINIVSNPTSLIPYHIYLTEDISTVSISKAYNVTFIANTTTRSIELSGTSNEDSEITFVNLTVKGSINIKGTLTLEESICEATVTLAETASLKGNMESIHKLTGATIQSAEIMDAVQSVEINDNEITTTNKVGSFKLVGTGSLTVAADENIISLSGVVSMNLNRISFRALTNTIHIQQLQNSFQGRPTVFNNPIVKVHTTSTAVAPSFTGASQVNIIIKADSPVQVLTTVFNSDNPFQYEFEASSATRELTFSSIDLQGGAFTTTAANPVTISSPVININGITQQMPAHTFIPSSRLTIQNYEYEAIVSLKSSPVINIIYRNALPVIKYTPLQNITPSQINVESSTATDENALNNLFSKNQTLVSGFTSLEDCESWANNIEFISGSIDFNGETSVIHPFCHPSSFVLSVGMYAKEDEVPTEGPGDKDITIIIVVVVIVVVLVTAIAVGTFCFYKRRKGTEEQTGKKKRHRKHHKEENVVQLNDLTDQNAPPSLTEAPSPVEAPTFDPPSRATRQRIRDNDLPVNDGTNMPAMFQRPRNPYGPDPGQQTLAIPTPTPVTGVSTGRRRRQFATAPLEEV